jgi:hypothetical protein
MELAFILAIAELVLKHGIPSALRIIQAWDVDNPTQEDIEDLKKRVPPPGEFFE